jgi:ribosomal protein L3
MIIGLVGKKSGMTRVFTEEGVSVPVTVIEVTPNRVTRLKDDDSDGYAAIQVTTGEVKQSRVSKPRAGQFAKSNVAAGRGLWEFRVDEVPEDLPSNAGTSGVRTIPTATPFLTALPDLSVSARPRVAYSRARRCPDTWGTPG